MSKAPIRNAIKKRFPFFEYSRKITVNVFQFYADMEKFKKEKSKRVKK